MFKQRGLSNEYIKAYKHRGTGDNKLTGHSGNYDAEGNLIGDGMANKRSVWTVTTKPFSEAHFATFPEDLIVDCIKAGCPENGIVLDPFMGAGTTALVASKLNRNFIGFELNADYIEIIKKRLQGELGMFNKLIA
jgi:DNA modification methylase